MKDFIQEFYCALTTEAQRQRKSILMPVAQAATDSAFTRVNPRGRSYF